MWWFLIPGVLVLLGFLPLGFLVGFDQTGSMYMIKIGLLRIPIGTKKVKTEKAKREKKPEFESRVPAKKKKGTPEFSKYFTLLKPVFKFLADFKRKLTVNDLQLQVIMGGSDPCDLSINFGRAWIGLGNIIPVLERFFVIKKRNLEIKCDYTSDRTQFQGKIDVSITLGRLLQIVIYHGISILKEYYRIIKQAKDGAMS